MNHDVLIEFLLDVDKEEDLNTLSPKEILQSIGHDFDKYIKYENNILHAKTNIISELSGSGISREDFLNLRKYVIVLYFLDQSKYSGLIKIIEYIFYVASSLTSFTESLKSWRNASLIAKVNYKFLTHDLLHDLENYHPKEIYFARSMLALKKFRFKFQLINGNFEISDFERNRIFEAIDFRLKKNGVIAIKSVLQNLYKNYDRASQRYVFERVSTIPLAPWGYLFKIALKSIENCKRAPGQKKAWDEAVEIATHYSVLMKWQEYSKIEMPMQSEKSTINLMQRIVVADQVYSLVQTNPEDVCEILSGVLLPIENKDHFKKCCTTNYIVIAKILIELSKNVGFTVFNSKLIFEHYLNTLPKHEIDNLLLELSFDKKEINKYFTGPHQAIEVNYLFRPFIRINSESYAFIDPYLCSLGFFEAALSKFRSVKIKENQIGDYLEKFISNKLNQKNITHLVNKKYLIPASIRKELNVRRKEAECDFIVETSDTLILIEVKKKGLTREAQSGDSLAVAIDLIKSFSKAQAQANWHELMLKRQGFIEFKCGTKLYLNERKIEKISISLNDFLSFHDGQLIQKVFRELINKQLNCDLLPDLSNQRRKDLEEINDTLAEITKQYAAPEFSEYFKKRWILFNCRFFNVFQLLEIFRNSDSPESFKKTVFFTRNASSGGRDWFVDFNFMKELTNYREEFA